jgi:Na+/citrate or Na+/malate symporter
MRELRARLCYLSCFLFVFGSVDFFLVPSPVFVLVLLVFACAVVRMVSDERPSVFRAWRRFLPTSLYKRRLCT